MYPISSKFLEFTLIATYCSNWLQSLLIYFQRSQEYFGGKMLSFSFSVVHMRLYMFFSYQGVFALWEAGNSEITKLCQIEDRIFEKDSEATKVGLLLSNK